MNPSDTDDRSLPSVSKWIRRSDKQEFIDICASPPSDGFFYANQHRMNRQQHSAVSGCVQETDNSKNNSMGQNIPRMTAGESTSTDSQVVCITKETKGFFKSFGPTGTYPSGNGVEGNGGSLLTRKVLNMSAADLEQWTKKNVAGQAGSVSLDDSHFHQHATDDSAPTPVDHLVARKSTQAPPMITKTEEGGSARLLEKYGTPDVTPSTTPAVTPVCSPQVNRRPGNPFFAGDSNKSQEGSWLFRSATTGSDNILYEAKMEIQPGTSSQTGKKTVRYVPRPSQLRELNFWSPTSM